MAAHGKVGTFNESIELWSSYIERLGHYFVANDVKDDTKKRAILLSSCGVGTYTIIRNLLAPDLPSTKSFDEIVEAAGKHFNPKPSSIVQRFRFNSRVRKEGESVADFVAQLRLLSEHCQFGDTLSDMLRYRIVCGINDQRIQRRLLAESNLTLTKAMELSLAMESADKDADTLKAGATGVANAKPVLQNSATSAGRGRTHKRNPPRKVDPASNVICHRCNGNHLATVCRFKEVQCHACGKMGHISKACRSRRNPTEASRKNKNPQTLTMTEQTEVDSDSSDQSYKLFSIQSHAGKPIQVNLTVNEKPLTMELDTGAAYSLISEQTYKATWSEGAPSLQQSGVKLHTYTGEQVVVVGSVTVTVCYNMQVIELPLLIVKGEGPSLFGRNWLSQIKLDWGAINQVTQQVCNKVLDKYPDVFKETNWVPYKALEPKFMLILRQLQNFSNLVLYPTFSVKE